MSTHRYPTLALIDRALAGARPPFAEAAGAWRLEELARALTGEFWGEAAWLTGRVPEAAFRLVCDALEADRALAARAAELRGNGAAAPEEPMAAA